MLFNFKYLAIQRFGESLECDYRDAYGDLEPDYGGFVNWVGRFALENIANSDMLYHDVEHTMLVTAVGQQILIGKHLIEGGVSPQEWAHFITALVCHDIGYVRGICHGDTDDRCATGVNGETVEMSEGATDAFLTPYHVDRSKQFVRERFGGKVLHDIDADVVAQYIELTRFPPMVKGESKKTKSYGDLLRAADFIGQLGDPDYLRKIPALYYEFEQGKLNQEHGYQSPGEMRNNYAKFFWTQVSPYIQDASRYLEVTQDGKQWLASLHAHVFRVEHREDGRLSG